MIHFVAGDILLSRAQVVAHGVAPNDPMTHGLALALRQKYTLPWDDVLPVLEERLGALAIPVYVSSEYHPGQVAHEPGLATP